MYLLNGQSLTKKDWLRPETQALNLEERKSTTTFAVGLEAPEIAVGDWLLDDEEPGAGIVWRVKTVDTQYNTETRTIQAEHIVSTLRDKVMFGDVTPETISGAAKATTCTAQQAIQYILSKHSLWQIGSIDGSFAGISNPYSFSGEDLYTALETVTGSLDGAYWDYDLTAVPFRIHIRKLTADAASEMRMSRNITTLKKTIDRSRMYTRFYPIGENDLHIDGDYVSRNENVYGVIEKIETDASKKTKPELLTWANERIARHCEPSVTITISGLEMSEATGEPLDHFTINTRCRVPLPEFGTTILEKITKISWRDKIGDKEQITMTLANQQDDIASIINRINKKNASGARAKAKKDKEDHAWFVDTEDHVAMVAEAIVGTDEHGVNWSRVASITVDGEGIHQRVQLAAEDASGAQAILRAAGMETDENGNILYSTASDPSGVKIGSMFQNHADKIGMVIGTDENGDDYIKGDEIAGEVTLSINKNGSSLRLNANRIRIGNGNSTTTLNDAVAVSQDGDIVVGGHAIVATGARSGFHGNVYGNVYYTAREGSGSNVHEVTAAALRNVAYDASAGFKIQKFDGNDALTISKNGNTLQFSDGTNVLTFSKATQLSANWDGARKFTVSASPQGVSRYTTIRSAVPRAKVTWNGNIGTASLQATIDEVETFVDVGTVTIDATDRYNAGWDYGITRRVRTTGAAASTDITIKTLDYSERLKITDTYTKSNGTTDVVNYVVAAKADRYNTGWGDCYDDVGLNYSSDQTLNMGGSVTVYPAVKPTPTGTHASKTSKGITVQAKAIKRITLDSAMNHAGSWWNYIIYYTDGTSQLMATDQSTSGLNMNIPNKTITANGTYDSRTTDSAAGYQIVTVNVPTGGGITGLTRFYGEDTNHNQVSNPTMYYYGYTGTTYGLKNAGAHAWYYK